MKNVQIAITGMGVVSPLGLNVEQSLENAVACRSGIRRYIPTLPPEGAQTARVGGVIEGFDHARYVNPRFPQQYDSSLGFTLAAVDEALRDARLGDLKDLGERFGCSFGCALAGADVWHRTMNTVYLQKNVRDIPPLTAFAATVTMINSEVALTHRLRGPSISINNACASGASAISAAADQIRLGRADAMLAGGYEASVRTWMVYGSFAGKGMTTTEDPERASRPFSVDREGFVLAEGAGVLVLERLDVALARGARVYAILGGESNTNDANHMIAPDSTGGAWARSMQLALRAAEVDPRDVDLVSAHAAGTVQGDIAETRAIKAVFGARAKELPVSATKSMHGHGFGASAAFETILAVAAMQRDLILPTAHFRGGDPDCDLDYVPNHVRKQRVTTLLKNSFGAGGVTTCLVLKRFSHEGIK